MRYQVQIHGHQIMDLSQVIITVRAIEQEGGLGPAPVFRRTLTVPDVDISTPEDWLRETLVGIVEYL